jgi:hypothetical protein
MSLDTFVKLYKSINYNVGGFIMKAFFTALIAVCCIAFLIFGNAYWKSKTVITLDKEKTSSQTADFAVDEQEDGTADTLISYTKNWPSKSQEAFKQALSEKRAFKILLLGSLSLGKESDGWAYIVKNNLEKAFGKKYMNVDVKEYEITSTDFVKENKQTELFEGNWDLILFEPFTLKDNGLVKIPDSLDNITKIMADVKSHSSQTNFILQPPHPIYNAKFYPIQVEELKKYCQTNSIPYLDHWSAWPDPNRMDLLSDLTKDQSAPNVRGHQIWSDYITNYLISK